MPTIDTVAALLAKSERTDNQEEAEAYLAKAQHLATLHAIDLATLAASHSAHDPRPTTLIQRTIRVGEPRRSANTHLVGLFTSIARPNDVMVDVARNSTYVVAYGTEDDVDTVEAIWLVCAPRMVAGAQAWMKSRRWEGDTTPGYQHGVGRVEVPITGRTAKATFMVAFAARIGARLVEARKSAVAEADAAPTGSMSSSAGGANRAGAELVLTKKSDQVRSFHRETSSARGSWRGYGGAYAGSQSDSAQAGDAAARATRLGDVAELRPSLQLPPA